jgi:hypothetical protein
MKASGALRRRTSTVTLGTETMTNDMTPWNSGRRRPVLLEGTRIAFRDSRYFCGKDQTPLAVENTKLAVVNLREGWQVWGDDGPPDFHETLPGEPVRERVDLGHDDESEWRVGADGSRIDPCQYSFFLYLVHPKTAEVFTFQTATKGGASAVEALKGQIDRVQREHPGALPVVELGFAPMPTAYGRKTKPAFKVVSWNRGDGGDLSAAPEPKPRPKIETHHRPWLRPANDDDIPF